jgi:hypothetical protein
LDRIALPIERSMDCKFGERALVFETFVFAKPWDQILLGGFPPFRRVLEEIRAWA